MNCLPQRHGPNSANGKVANMTAWRSKTIFYRHKKAARISIRDGGQPLALLQPVANGRPAFVVDDESRCLVEIRLGCHDSRI